METNQDQPRPIGLFDSGIGGFSVMGEVMRSLPEQRLVYFGDTGRVPYGSKSAETVTRYSLQICRFLLEKQVKAIVIACNTASALAMEELQEKMPVPVLGVIEPGAKAALAGTRNGRIGVIGTEATIRSGAYERCLLSLDPKLQVFSQACPLFVPLVEEGWAEDVVTERVAQRYLEKLLMKNIDTLIMGCTHYPYLKRILQDVCGKRITLVNPAYETAEELKKIVGEENSPAAGYTPDIAHEFYCSDDPERMAAFAGKFLAQQGIKPEMVRLG